MDHIILEDDSRGTRSHQILDIAYSSLHILGGEDIAHIIIVKANINGIRALSAGQLDILGRNRRYKGKVCHPSHPGKVVSLASVKWAVQCHSEQHRAQVRCDVPGIHNDIHELVLLPFSPLLPVVAIGIDLADIYSRVLIELLFAYIAVAVILILESEPI
ncbi:MAG: hypothetical protein A4E43_00767 [Methanosaeta sp. PtaB.Bin005]|nr:MAG: hypothetical protein A4E43_00767 [Methanosaeta sp. PtaB.Bin005]